MKPPGELVAEARAARRAVRIARSLLDLRRLRERAFSPASSTLGDPSWYILLDLFVARQCSERLTVTDLLSANRLAATTGLRYLAVLERLGHVEMFHRDRDPGEARVVISDEANQMVAELLVQTNLADRS